MTVTIRLDTKGLTAGLSALEQKQIPFSIAKALNATGLDFQKAERIRLGQAFTLRRKDFIEKQGVKLIGGFATKTKPSITFGVDPKASFLDKFEAGDTKTPTRGAALAVPESVKRNKRDLISPSNKPRSLIARLGKKSGAGGVFKLDQRKGSLDPGIYQRTGRGGKKLKLLFALEPSAHIPRSLQFEQTFIKTVKDKWQSNFATAFADALRTAK